ncbi:neuroplastin [Aricia agestis]|uniref:neuroplastin n=1 Tax=Aricia agestis TaxID=91739 RepID=UPI001C209CFE|nr:neuroplastin [Aricia agestis]
MAGTVYCLPVVLLFLASAIPSEAQSEAPATEAAAAASGAAVGGADAALMYELRSNLTLTCRLSSAAGLAYTWTKNETDVTALGEMKGRYELQSGGAVFHIARTLEDDWGNYSCAVGGDVQRWEVHGRPHLKVPANTNVVEGQKLKVQCKVIGKPYPRVSWQYSNDSKTWVEAGAALGGRVELAASEQGVPDGMLIVTVAERADAGSYNCSAPGAAPATTVLRVKDMYAALWPFLGICAEVFVLCAVILVYERRRTKPEAEDSDVDADQKKS